MKKLTKILIATGTAVLVAGGTTAGILLTVSGGTEPSVTAPVQTETAKVTRGELVERVQAKGTLSFDGVHTVGTTLGGTVTALPGIGSTIERGGELFRIDDQPVILMQGALPGWRSFEEGMEDGRDVQQLEENLSALGFFEREPDQEFAYSTWSAIKRWQKALGLKETGMIESGRVVFTNGALRVSELKATVGDASGPALIEVSGTNKVVTALVPPAMRSVVTVGAAVSIDLPDGTATTGTVASVGSPQEKEDSSGTKSVKLPVTISIDDPATVESFSDVGVTLQLSRVLSEDTLLVPVLALLAQPGGGFAVEVKSNPGKDGAAKTHIVPVELGSFADSLVEVISGDVKEDDTVVVGK